MSDKPRLVHRPKFGERPGVLRHERREGPAPPAEPPAPDPTWPEIDERRDPMREVQMENIHPLRLRLLLEIERTRSISAAAQACGIGQPSASMHVRNLEATLGHRLVTRNGRGSTLTPAGKVVVPHAARMLATLDSMRRAVDALGARGGGELTIVASHMPSVVILPPVLRRLADCHPGLAVELRTLPSDAAVREVARGEADIGIAGESSTPEPVVRRQIMVDELVGVAAPGLLVCEDGCITLRQLAAHRLLLGNRGSSSRMVVERCLARAGYRPPSVWEVGSSESTLRTVAQGLGVGFVSRLLVREQLARRELIAFSVSGVEQMLRPIHVMEHAARELTGEASAFMSLLAEAVPSSGEVAAMSYPDKPMAVIRAGHEA
jgi:molybdate transport repressor ModE-like protein